MSFYDEQHDEKSMGKPYDTLLAKAPCARLAIPSRHAKILKRLVYISTPLVLSGCTVTVSDLLINHHFDYPTPPSQNSFSTQRMFSQIFPCLS